MKITDQIGNQKMSGLQIRAVVVAITLVVLDGYDVSLTSFSAPYLEQGFGVSKAQLGLVMSGALIGMLVGSIVVAPLADRIGRRRMGIMATITIAVGMFIGPFASIETGTWPLVLSRIITGVGIGALVAVVGVILSEYTGKRVYPLVMAIYAAAINIGGLLGSVIVGPMLAENGWQYGWWVGFALSAIAAIATFFLLPESLAWLSEGKRPDSLARLNAILVKMGRPALAALPETDSVKVKADGALRTVFTGRAGFYSVLMIVGYIAYMISFYFMTNWSAATVAGANRNPALASSMVAAFSIGGILGNVVFGFIGNRVNLRILTPVFLVVATGALSLFGIVGPSMPTAWWTLFLASFFVCSGTAGFYAIVPSLYPTLARSTGFGIVIGAGRFGGIAAPIVGGAAFDAGMSMGAAFTVFALPMLLAAVCIVVLHLSLKNSAAAAVEQPAPVGTAV
ncbi:MFS family permease [Nocardioides luteus]|uniref:MFS transporter n=1 Tax=Nocardioides luteus TaxID=1844 RepID=A0ABQ5T1C0_9ACTN|nr:MFS transporter [Nocardioides luteus]MDR7310339.1 MFS family permease [Nocardioides luteus]GGR53336.1 MFS transporter [Nocardioides luteus]GLJ69881.1 MFS transporter [Nocardioides luteus]